MLISYAIEFLTTFPTTCWRRLGRYGVNFYNYRNRGPHLIRVFFVTIERCYSWQSDQGWDRNRNTRKSFWTRIYFLNNLTETLLRRAFRNVFPVCGCDDVRVTRWACIPKTVRFTRDAHSLDSPRWLSLPAKIYNFQTNYLPGVL